jgi:hypothetical protein
LYDDIVDPDRVCGVCDQAVTHALPEECAVGGEGGEYAVVFGVSGCENWRLYDLEHGRQVLGYYPEERAVVETAAIGLPPEMVGNDRPLPPARM